MFKQHLLQENVTVQKKVQVKENGYSLEECSGLEEGSG